MYVILIIVLLCLSAMFSGYETALTNLPIYKLNRLKIAQKPLIKTWKKQPHHILISILTGNTIVNMMISILFVLSFVNMLPFKKELVEILAYILAIFLIFMFGEITPKLYSTVRPAFVVDRLTNIMCFILKPLLKILGPVLNLFPKEIETTSTSILDVKDKLSYITDTKTISREKVKMLESVLKFHTVKVNEIMTSVSKLDKVDISVSEGDVISEIISYGRTRTLVFKGEHLIGYILARDLLLNLIDKNYDISDVIRPILIVSSDCLVEELLNEFRKRKINIACVVDENNKLKGVVTIEDIIEEIVGEVLDEYDIEKKRYVT